MKYYKLSFIFFIVAVFFVTCKTEEEMATKKAKEFLECLNAKKYDKAKEIATPESEAMIDFMKSMASLGSNEKPKAIKNLNCRIDRDTAHCTYTQGDEEKSLILVKLDHKWLVDMKKEAPDMTSQQSDSIAAVNNYSYQENDTVTYFDVRLLEAKDINGSAHLIFDISNRSEYNIQHLWMALYFSDRNNKFILKKDVMFNFVLNNTMYDDISNSDEIKNQGKAEVVVENNKVSDIGEIYIYPFRMQMDAAYYESYGKFGDLGNLSNFSKYYTLIKNLTDADIKIVF